MNFYSLQKNYTELSSKPVTLTRELKPYTQIKKTSMSLMTLSRLRKLIWYHVRLILKMYFFTSGEFSLFSTFSLLQSCEENYVAT